MLAPTLRLVRLRRARALVALVSAIAVVGGGEAAHASPVCTPAGASPYDRPSLTADGSTVVFTTGAALVPEDANRTLDVYAADVATGSAELISAAQGGAAGAGRSSAPAVSADGRFVVFQSDSSDLVASDDPAGVTDVLLRDRVAGTTVLVSAAPAGAPGAGASTRPAISPDGRLVAFESIAPDLVPGDTNVLTDVFVRDLEAGTTVRASVGPDGSQADGLGSFAPSVSDTGRVAFHSTASTWVTPGDDVRSFLRDGVYYVRNVYVRDLAAATTTHVSITDDGSPPDGLSLYPSISADGTRVAFLSSSTNLVPGDTNNRADLKGFAQSDVFVRDLAAGTTTRVSVASDGTEANGLGSSGPAISADGARVTYESSASNLAGGDTNGALDVFVHDTLSHATTRASETEDGGDPGSSGVLAFGSVSSSLSAEGDAVAFVSSAPGLVGAALAATETPHTFGVFVRSEDGALHGPIGVGCADPAPAAAASAVRPRSRAADASATRVRPEATGALAPHTVALDAPPTRAGVTFPVLPAALVMLCVAATLRRPRRHAALVAVLALAATSLAAGPASAHHHSAVQPGAPVLRDTGFGTASLNFVFRDRATDSLYIGTAAHAVREHWVGDRVANDEVGEFGTLVYSREGVFSFSTQDFALIRIDPDRYGLVEPAVRHWGGPTGVARLADLVPGLPTYQYGQGAYFRTSEPTRLKPGVIASIVPDPWGYVGWIAEARHGFGGDSGSPILSGPDGEALAVTILFASAAFGDPGVQMGPSIELIMQELRLAGFDLELVTAPFHGPAGDAAGTAEHCAARPVEGEVLNDGCVRPGSDL